MFEIDTITIIISAAVIVMAIIGSFTNPFFRKIRFAEEDDETDDDSNATENAKNTGEEQSETVTPITVLITTHDNSIELKNNLSAVLSQDYPDFQVVIVGEQCETETEDLLKRMSAEHPNLYYTLIPEGSRYMSKKKLQITIGVKASKNEWIILIDPACKPDSDQWLKTMAANCSDETNVVMGVTRYTDETKDYYRFDQLRDACYFLRRAQVKEPYGTNMHNVCFRKSEFMKGNGFLGNLQYIRGEYHFLINKYADDFHTKLELSRKAWMTVDEPTQKAWRNCHLFYLSAQKELDGNMSMRLLRFFDHLVPHLSIVLSLAVIVFGILTMNYIDIGAGSLAILILFFVRMGIAKCRMNKFDDDISAIKLPFYEWSVICHNLINRIRYWKADKYNFTSHKL